MTLLDRVTRWQYKQAMIRYLRLAQETGGRLKEMIWGKPVTVQAFSELGPKELSLLNEALDEIFLAVISSDPLRKSLIFKGGRTLNLHIGEMRKSVDIDSNLVLEMMAGGWDLAAPAAFLKKKVVSALRCHFKNQEPVKFRCKSVEIVHRLPKDHPLGWNAFILKIQLQHDCVGIRELPELELDVATHDELREESVETVEVKGVPAQVYSLHRIAAEKLRAYLNSLPAYWEKMKDGPKDFRGKDLHDLARILRARPATDIHFWRKAGLELRLLCQMRFVDCYGLDSFKEDWALIRQRYMADENLRNIPFAEAEQALETVVGLFQEQGLLPFEFPVRQRQVPANKHE